MYYLTAMVLDKNCELNITINERFKILKSGTPNKLTLSLLENI
jgi:hypothetical protein